MGFSWELVFSRWSLEKLRHGCDREAADYSPASLHGSCCARHRLDYVYIAAAAANVPVQGLDDLVTVGRRVAFQQAHRRQNHPRHTVTTLHGAFLEKRPLHGMQFPVLGQSFDRFEFASFDLVD